MATDTGLDKVKFAYFEAGREQPKEYPPLPPWEVLSIELRDAFVHVYARGRIDVTTELAEKTRGGQQG
jgi:hypothetical protein